MGCGCGRNSVVENPVKTEVKQEGNNLNNNLPVTFDALIGKLNETIGKVVFKQKNDPATGTFLEVQNDIDLFFVLILDLNDQKLLQAVNNKVPSLKELQEQVKKIHANLSINYDFEPAVKKLFLILNFQQFFAERPHSASAAVAGAKSLKTIELNDSLGGDESFKRALQANNSIQKVIFKFFDETRLQKVLDTLKTSKTVQTLTLKDLKLAGDGLRDIFTTFFKENTSLTSLNLMKNKIDTNDGCGALKDLVLSSTAPLQKLNLSNNALKSDTFSGHLAQIFKERNLMTKFKLNRCQSQTFDTWSSIWTTARPINIQYLDLSFNHVNLDHMSEFIAENTNLTKLILQKIRIPRNSDLTRFGNVFIASPSLKHLAFFFDFVEEDGKVNADPSKLVDFYNGLAQPAACEKSYKSFKVEMTPEIMTAFANVVGSSDSLTEVNLSLCVFKEDSFNIMLNGFVNSTNFRSLILDTFEGPSDAITSISTFLSSNKSVSKLDLSGNKISTADLNTLGDAIVSNGNLKSIILSNSLSSETDANEFLTKLAGTTLEEIDFSFCDGANSYSEAFGKLLAGCVTLKNVKVGRKQEDFDSKTNNNMFQITNKLAIENISISNIKIDGQALKDLILNCDNLKSLTFNNSVKTTNFIKYIVERNIPLDSLSFTAALLEEEDKVHIAKSLGLLRSFSFRPTHLEPQNAEGIMDGLLENKTIEFFEITFDKLIEPEYQNVIKKYYANVPSCDRLTNLMIYNLAEGEEEKRQTATAKENSKNFFVEFHKSLTA